MNVIFPREPHLCKIIWIVFSILAQANVKIYPMFTRNSHEEKSIDATNYRADNIKKQNPKFFVDWSIPIQFDDVNILVRKLSFRLVKFEVF